MKCNREIGRIWRNEAGDWIEDDDIDDGETTKLNRRKDEQTSNRGRNCFSKGELLSLTEYLQSIPEMKKG